MQIDQMNVMSSLALEAYHVQAEIPESPIGATSYFDLDAYSAFSIDTVTLQERLALAPAEYDSKPVVIAIPRPNGGFERFNVWEAGIMAPGLAEQFPDMKTYRGQGIDNPASTLAADLTPLGFRAQVLAPGGSWYVDPYYHLDTSVFVSYFAHDNNGEGCTCELCIGAATGDETSGVGLQGPGGDISLAGPGVSYGGNLRTFRTAIAATGEYSAFFGGTVANAQAGIVTSINRVSGVFEKEFAVRLQLIANNTSIVYTNSGTDPYTNGDGGTMLDENQANVDAVIGNANYDLGHIFSTGGGGVAVFGIGNNTLKAMGVTGSNSPTGDSYDIDYVAHEMGHQLYADHTFNAPGNSQRVAASAYEPGSGSTIMSYAGIIAGNNVQNNSDDYFHARSIGQILTRLNAVPGLGTTTANGNAIPVANAGSDYTIPANTPFALTGSATDGNGDALTYSWEQYDLGTATTLGTYSATAPIFRSIESTSPVRTFPTLTNLLANTTSVNEVMPTGARTLNFTLTVRDNRSGGGAVDMDDSVVTVAASTGFSVTAPNTAVTWTGGTMQTVTWNVAGTNAAPINTSLVNILLSTDGGNTYPTTILANTANDGSETITVPNLPTTKARIKVQPVNNIYFDISNANFTILNGSSMQVTGTTPAPDGTITAPTTTLDIAFSESINPATLSTADLTVNLGNVTGVSLLNANTARFTISNLAGEGTLNATLAGGAVTSTLGNASGVFSASYAVDISTISFPVAFSAAAPAGTRVYSASTTGAISFAGDTDSFTLALDPGQTISAIVIPSSTLRAKVTVASPDDLVSFVDGATNGATVSLNSVAINPAGTTTVTVAGLGGTTGAYTLQIYLNAASEGEGNGGTANNTLATAQSITPALLSLGETSALAAVIGQFDGGSAAQEAEPNDTSASANNVGASFGVVSTNLYQLSLTGNLNVVGDSDYFNIGTLQAGDIITISEMGTGAGAGTLVDPRVYLYRAGSTASVTNDDDNGVGADSLLYRFTVLTTDTYYIRGRSFGDDYAGTYRLGVLLENTLAAPSTGGLIFTENEAVDNNSKTTAQNVSTSWRAVTHLSTASGSISSATDLDTFAYTLAAGDILTVNARSTSSLDAKVQLLNSAGTPLLFEDGGSTGPGLNSPIYSYRVTTAGTYYVEVGAASGTGSYELDVYLNTLTAPPTPQDHYSLSLVAGQTLHLGLEASAAGTYTLDLLDTLGTTLATSQAIATNYDRTLTYTAPANQTVLMKLTGSNTAPYTLVTTVDASLDTEPNDTLATPQPLGNTFRAVGALTGTDDWYSLNLTAGQGITLLTATPGDGSGLPVNSLNPKLEVYSPSGTLLLADSNSAADGRNALLTFPATESGIYSIRILPENGTSGEYILSAQEGVPANSVTGFTVNNGELQRSRLTTVTVNFALPIDAATLTGAGAISFTRTTATAAGTVGTVVATGAAGANGRVIVSPGFGMVTSIALSFDNADASGVTPGVEYGSLADGHWQLAIPGVNFLSTLGDLTLRRLFGDESSNGTVDAIDFGSLGTTFGLSSASASFRPSFDFNSDGIVDGSDFSEFGARFGFTL